MDEWIDANKSLPETAEPVLVVCSGEVSLAWQMSDVYDNETYWEDAYADHLQGITHWQPLPPPPQNK